MDATGTSEAWADALLSGRDDRWLHRQRPICSSIAKKLGKKRMRRVEVEIPLFQHQVHDLELKLKRIKLQKAAAVGSKYDFKTRNSGAAIPTRQEVLTKTSIWDGIAERQLKARLRAEKHQQELKNRQFELAKLSVALQKFLHKFDNNKELVERVCHKPKQRFWDFSMDQADEIFTDQLAVLMRIYLQLQSTPSRTLYPSSDLFIGREVVKSNPKVAAGFIMENRSGSLLPFSLDVAVQAYWRFFGCGCSKRCCSRHTSDLSSDIIARSFSLRANFEGFTSEVRGKYTCRKYVDDDSVTLMLVRSGDILEIGGAKFDGVQLHKRGFIKLRRVLRQGPGQISTSTVVETTFDTIPVFHERILDRAKQTQTLINEVNKSYAKVNKSFCQKMGGLLLGEDWKATFGREMLEA